MGWLDGILNRRRRRTDAGRAGSPGIRHDFLGPPGQPSGSLEPESDRPIGPGMRRRRNNLTGEQITTAMAGAQVPGLMVLGRQYSDAENHFGSYRLRCIMARDPVIRSSQLILNLGTLGDRMTFSPSELARDKGRARYWAETCEAMILGLRTPIRGTLLQLMNVAQGFGSKIAEIDWGVAETGPLRGMVVARDLVPKPLHSYHYIVDRRNRQYGILAATYRKPYRAIFGRAKYLHLAWEPEDNDPRGRDFYEGIYPYWNSLIQAIPESLLWVVQFGRPITWLEKPMPPGTTTGGNYMGSGGTIATEGRHQTDAERIAELQKLRGGGVGLIEPGAKLNMWEQKSDGSGFETVFDLYTRMIVRGILLAPQVSMDSKHGLRANFEAAKELLRQFLTHCRAWVTAAVEWDLLWNFIAANAGPDEADEYTPDIGLGTVTIENLSSIMGGLAGVGWFVTPNQKRQIDALIGLEDPEWDGAFPEGAGPVGRPAAPPTRGGPPGET